MPDTTVKVLERAVLLGLIELELKVAVTPAGTPETLRLTLETRPTGFATEMEVVFALWVTIVRALVEAASEKLGCGITI